MSVLALSWGLRTMTVLAIIIISAVVLFPSLLPFLLPLNTIRESFLLSGTQPGIMSFILGRICKNKEWNPRFCCK